MDDEAEKIVLEIPEEEPAEIESPEASEVQLPLENGKTTNNGTRTPSIKSDNGKRSPSIRSENGKTPSVKSDSDKTASIKSDNGKISGNGVEELIEEVTDPYEEKSRSQEELRKLEELSLDGKPTSLEELGRERAQRVKAKIYRQCHRRFREIIGKREMKNEELEKQQGDLKHRLNMLECSMPAVMVWNIWRMSQGNCVPNLKRVMEKQFLGPAAGEVYCPSTPSRHFDCRVREIEAERKQAQKRVEEARALWSEKTSLLEERSKRLEEVKRIQEETKLKIEQLIIEAKRLKEAAKIEDDGSCETGECGVIQCKKKWLEKVPSNASIKSADIVCLDKLQELAQNEYCIKRHIADLESREEAYMRTLQQADELWCKLESDAASTVSALQEQLDMKTAANQQMADRIVALEDVIEQLRARLGLCTGELEKYMSKSKIDALIGRDDDFAEMLDKALRAAPDARDKMVGIEREMMDRDMLAKMDMSDAKLGIHPEDFAYEDERLQEARAYLEKLGFSLSELDKYPDDLVCAADFACNDLVFTETGLTEEEMQALKEGRVTAKMLLEQCGVSVDLELEQEAAGVERIERTVRSEMYEMEETREAVGMMKEREMMIEKSVEEIGVGDQEDDVPADDTTTYEDTTDMEDFVDAPAYTETRVHKRDVDEGEDLSAMEVTTEPSLEFPSEEVVHDESVVVPRTEMLDWQDDVDTIRSTIAECPDCIVVKKDADELAVKMARYTGVSIEDQTITEVTEIADSPREILAPSEIPKPEVPVAVEAKPEVVEAEVTVAPSVEEKIVEAKVAEPDVKVEPEEPPEVLEPPAVAPVEAPPPTAPPVVTPPPAVAPAEAPPPPKAPPAAAPPPTVPSAEAPSPTAPPAVAPPPAMAPAVAPPPAMAPAVAPPPAVAPAEAPVPPKAPPAVTPPPTVPPAVTPPPAVPPAEAPSPTAPPAVTPPPAVAPAEAPPPTIPPAVTPPPAVAPVEAPPPTAPPVVAPPPTPRPAEAPPPTPPPV
ncbi:formin-like protein 5, partial [Ceratina calcarata]|uniref:Formin-like protein 5 n=1 Tax=Ceratina calcarata TaxID=156304 RepID=A0AAJ7WG47_9HYME